jgi:2-polyprenyl-3-methyl-5-hydroxy-6-metoxy-1,4-benzoquinol methylase
MSINYSVERLQQDKESRSHILRQLSILKEKYNIHNRKIIELGCGTGTNLELFNRDNVVVGVEGLPDAVNFVNDQLRIPAIQANLEEPLTFVENESYEWVICLDVLEHLMNPFSLMTEMKRILIPRGRAIINVPNHLEIKGRTKILFGSGLDVHNYFPESEEWNNPHVRFFTHGGILKMFQRSGFNVVEDVGINFSTLNRLKFKWLSKSIYDTNPALFAAALFFVIEKFDE